MPKTTNTEQLLCLILYLPIVAMVMEEMRLQRTHVLSIPLRRFIREGGEMSQLPPSPQILQALESHSGLQTAPTPTLKKFQVSVADIPKVTLGHFKVFFFKSINWQKGPFSPIACIIHINNCKIEVTVVSTV